MLDHNIESWREEYKTSLQGWREDVSAVHLHYKELVKKSWQKTKYVTRNLPFAPEKMVMCPPHSVLNFAPNQQHRSDYATGAWEGSSAEAMLDANNNIIGANVILHRPRLARFIRSLRGRGYQLAIPIEKFAQSVLDTIAVHGTDILRADDGSPARAYIRPSAGSGVGPWGVSLSPGYFIESSVLVFRWGNYFSDVVRVDKEGVKAVITGGQRMFPIVGKHASNYGAASTDGSLARNLKYDELIYLAPYGIKDGVLDFNLRNFDELMRYGVLADGPGEEILAVLNDGETIVYPPMRVNRLGGTVLDYIVKHLAPKLGLRTQEQDITLEQIRSGKIAGLAFVGNAVKVTPVGKVDIVKPNIESPDGEKVETLFAASLHPTIIKIRDQFLAELCGKKPPSHDSLLTPVDLVWGGEFRDYLDQFWSKVGLN